MKKLACMVLAAILICTFAMAETVFVTISNDQGELVVAAEPFDVSDADGDGVVSISDALFRSAIPSFIILIRIIILH